MPRDGVGLISSSKLGIKKNLAPAALAKKWPKTLISGRFPESISGFLIFFLEILGGFLVGVGLMLAPWMPSCRNRFTEADFDFVASLLSQGKPHCHLAKLWIDPEGRRELLDLKEVFRGLIESPVALAVTPRFYFYVIIRHSFLQAGLGDTGLSDYVAGVMAKRVSASGDDPFQDVTRGFTHAAEFLSFISTAKGRMRFHLQVAAGNQFLILTGLYPEFLRRRCEKGEAPDLEFYECFARRSFRSAAANHLATDASSRTLLSTLSEAMPTARRALNRVAEETMFLGD